MKIVERTSDRLVLSGIPGQARWMIAAAAIGGGLTVAVIPLLLDEISSGNTVGILWTGFGLLIAQAIMWTGVVTLAVGRERLELDLTRGKGRYDVRSPIVEVSAKPFAFDIDASLSVQVRSRLERHRSVSASGLFQAEREAELYDARILIGTPRRAVTLTERGLGGVEHVLNLARQVADFLGIEVDDRRSADSGPTAGTGDLRTPVAGRSDVFDLDIGPQPEPREWELAIDPSTGTVRLTRIRRGGPLAVGCLMLIGTFIALIAVAMVVGVWLPDQTFNGTPITLVQRWLLTLPGLVLGLAVPWAWIALLRGKRRITVGPDLVVVSWDYPGRAAVGCVPGLARLHASGARLPTRAIESVLVIKAPSGRVVELRAGAKTGRFGSDADNEQAEKASLAWAAGTLRAAIRAIGS